MSVVPLSIEVMRKTIGPQIDGARAGVQEWLRSGVDPGWIEIAKVAVPALKTLLERAWVRVDEEWSTRLRESFAIAEDPVDLRFHGRVAEIVELVWWALSANRPPLPPRGPLAAEMSLGVGAKEP